MNLDTGNKQEKKKTTQRIQKLGLRNIHKIDISSQGNFFK